MFITQDAVNDAVLFKLFELAQNSDGNTSSDKLSKEFKVQIGSRRVALAFERLGDKDLAVRHPNGWFQISNKGYDQVEKSLLIESSGIANFARDGEAWLSNQTLGEIAVPASDRIVSRSDNGKPVQELAAGLDQLIEDIQKDNEAGAELGDDRALIAHELSASRELIRADRFYLRKLFQILVPALKFLADKFSGGAIGAAAKHLFDLIVGLS